MHKDSLKIRLQSSVQSLQQHFGMKAADAVVVAGSGFRDALPPLVAAKRVNFAEIAGFPSPTVQGHEAVAVMGQWPGQPGKSLLYLLGRVHLYEGYDKHEVVQAVRSLAMWGVPEFILTNAAGSLRDHWPPGRFMLLSDHINLTGSNPLIGWKQEGLMGPMFPDMSEVYDLKLRQRLQQSARSVALALEEGVYLSVSGPNYETPAEIRAFRQLGADAVGMSTVLESLALRQLGARVAAISLLSNWGAGLMPGTQLHHDEVLQVMQKAQLRFQPWMLAFFAS